MNPAFVSLAHEIRLSNLGFIELGKNNALNLELPKVKLQALYTFIKQLYFGGANALKEVQNSEEQPQKLADMLRELSIIPEWIKELKMLACRKGVMCTMALAKAYHPEMTPELLAGGFLEYKVYNTPFTPADFGNVVKETRHHATTIAHSLDLSSFQHGYDSENRCIAMPNPRRLAWSQFLRRTRFRRLHHNYQALPRLQSRLHPEQTLKVRRKMISFWTHWLQSAGAKMIRPELLV